KRLFFFIFSGENCLKSSRRTIFILRPFAPCPLLSALRPRSQWDRRKLSVAGVPVLRLGFPSPARASGEGARPAIRVSRRPFCPPALDKCPGSYGKADRASPSHRPRHLSLL